jgi:hypothetical protein
LDLEILLKDRLQLQVPAKIKTSQANKNDDILKEKEKASFNIITASWPHFCRELILLKIISNYVRGDYRTAV